MKIICGDRCIGEVSDCCCCILNEDQCSNHSENTNLQVIDCPDFISEFDIEEYED